MTNVEELWRNIIAASLTCGILCIFSDNGTYPWFVIGLVYASFFEYFYHRCISHTELLPLASIKHRQHHRHWRGGRVIDRTRRHLNEDWYFFPVALLAHFAVAKFAGWIPYELLLGFTVFYLQYEIFHWATHIKGNWIDDVLMGVPGIWYLRRQQIRWHLRHHDIPKSCFNFTPPYTGDHLLMTSMGHVDPQYLKWEAFDGKQ